jgi:peptidoglycan/xylan/chitin deacetylase (PgdA/CDA1 family)
LPDEVRVRVEAAVRVLVIVVAALATLGLAAFGVVAAQKATERSGPALGAETAASSPTPAPGADKQVAANSVAAPLQAPIAVTPVAPPTSPPAAPTRLAQAQQPTGQNAPGTVLAQAQDGTGQNVPATALAKAHEQTAQNAPGTALANASQTGPGNATNNVPACDKPGGMGLARIVQIDTTGGPAFGFEHFKQYDFLRDHEVVLTFDDGPWPQNTPMVIKALTDECLKATFFEIGEHATWHPELAKLVAAAGMTIGSHTWSHKDLAKNPYAGDIEQAKQEIEMGVSAVHHAVDGPIAPFFRFPDLQQPPALLSYLATRNIATFSTDIDSFDFKMRRPEQVVQSVISKLKKRGKGIVLMHDFQHATAEALPEILRQLKANGFKVVHMVPKEPATTLAKYDDMVRQQDKMDVTNTRPESSVVKTISGD